MKVYAFDSADWADAEKNGLTKSEVVATIERGLHDVGTLLPRISPYLNVIVRPHFVGIIPEYGTGGYTQDADLISIVFDKAVPYGAEKILQSLYQTTFHEGDHAVRYNTTKFDGSFINSVVSEGLATVFERDKADYKPLYGDYEDDVTMNKWWEELRATDWDKRDELFFTHPDGRRWVGYKTGTWLIDNVLRNSEKTIEQLTSMPCEEIVKLAKLEE